MKMRLFLVGFSLVVALLLGEVGLRILGFSYPNFYQYDVHTGAALRPGAAGWYKDEGRAFVRINAAGMRDDREVVREKPTGVYRIAVLGDSYAEALQVDVSRTFWRLLEEKLNICRFGGDRRVEVLNFGVSGYSTAQELITLQQRVKPYTPDMVMLAFLSGNDVRDNSEELAGPYPRPYFTLEHGQLIEDTSFRQHWIFKLKSSDPWRWFQQASDFSRIVQLLNKAKNIAGQPLSAPRADGGGDGVGLDDHIYLSHPPPVWERAWQITEALVAEIRSEAQRQGARFLLVTLSNPGQVLPDPSIVRANAAKLGEQDLFYPERRMRKMAEREGIDAVFLAEAFADYAARHKVYLHGFPNTQMGSGHWNEAGHRLAAALIAEKLCAGR